ncbi:hypothetical protein KCP75_00205 [Salmonella enterica subsp. enterica]|nr:hypothetical protein KCP75_00205 [Salmonella enterica subsp. enterica]
MRDIVRAAGKVESGKTTKSNAWQVLSIKACIGRGWSNVDKITTGADPGMSSASALRPPRSLPYEGKTGKRAYLT